MNFFDTVAGHNFINYQVPRLIEALERMSEALEENNKLLKEAKEDKDSSN